MPIIKNIIFFILLMFSVRGYAFTLNQNNLPPIEFSQYKALTKEQRLQVAHKLLNNLSDLSSVIPTLSKISNENLKRQKEFIASSLNKIVDKNGVNKDILAESSKNENSYLNNPDHNIYEIINWINSTRQDLQCVINSEKLSSEMYCWGLVAALFLENKNIEFDLNILIKRDEIKDINLVSNNTMDPLYKLSMLYRIYHNFGMKILYTIILPYLENHS